MAKCGDQTRIQYDILGVVLHRSYRLSENLLQIFGSSSLPYLILTLPLSLPYYTVPLGGDSSYDMIRWTILTCAQKLTCSQLSLPHGNQTKKNNEETKNSSGDEIANVNFFYNIAHVEASAYAH